jgi:hypothetical protein
MNPSHSLDSIFTANERPVSKDAGHFCVDKTNIQNFFLYMLFCHYYMLFSFEGMSEILHALPLSFDGDVVRFLFRKKPSVLTKYS